MHRTPRYLFDLIDLDRLSAARFDAALEAAFRELVEWCRAPGAPLRVADIRTTVFDVLPKAFDKGLLELAQARDGRFGWGTDGIHLTFAWSPLFDVMVDGGPLWPFRIAGVARCTAIGSAEPVPRIETVHDAAHPLALELGRREWTCTMTLAVGAGRHGEAAPFYERRDEIVLPAYFDAVPSTP